MPDVLVLQEVRAGPFEDDPAVLQQVAGSPLRSKTARGAEFQMLGFDHRRVTGHSLEGLVSGATSTTAPRIVKIFFMIIPP